MKLAPENLESKYKFPALAPDLPKNTLASDTRTRTSPRSRKALHSAVVPHAPLGPFPTKPWELRIENYIFQTSLLLALWSPGPRLRSTPPAQKQLSSRPSKNPSPPMVGHRPSLGRHSIVQWFRARTLVAKVFVVMLLRVASPHRVFHQDRALSQPNRGNLELKTKFSRPASSSPCGPLVQGCDPHPRHPEFRIQK